MRELLTAAAEDLERDADLLRALARDHGHCSYPLYGEGIRDEDQLFSDLREARTGEHSELLRFVLHGRTEGFLSYYRIPEEHYLQLTGCFVRRGTAQALALLTARLEASFPGDTLYFGFPAENREAGAWLTAHGFVCAERTLDHICSLSAPLSPAPDPRVEPVTRKNFDRFRNLYQPEPGTFWTAERILPQLDRWALFLFSENGVPLAAQLTTGDGDNWEIFGTVFAGDAFRTDALSALLHATREECCRRGGCTLRYFCPLRETAVLTAQGFRCLGESVLYTKTI